MNQSHEQSARSRLRLGITAKAFTPILVLALVILVVGLVVVQGLVGLSNQMDRVANELAPSGDGAAEALESILRERAAVERTLNTRDPAPLEDQAELHEQAQSLLSRIEATTTGEARVRVGELRETHASYNEILHERVLPPTREYWELQDRTLPSLASEMVSELLELESSLNSRGLLDAEARVEEALVEVLRTQNALLTFMLRFDGEEAERASGYYASARESLDAVDRVGMTEEQRNMLDASVQRWQRYGGAFQEMQQALEQLSERSQTELLPAGEALTGGTAELVDVVFDELTFMSGEIYETSRTNITIISLIFLVGLVVGLGVGWVVTRGYVKPLLRLDEFVHRLVSEMDAGNGDLTRRVDVISRDEVGQLGNNVNRFIETLQKVLSTINQETSQLASAAEELTAITGQTQKGVNQQKTETDQVATAMNEMSATVQEIASNATDASSAANEASESASEGRRVVAATVDSINGLVEAVEEGQRAVSQVDQNAESITQVIDVINGIAEQTNLLALNAAIEAARAGQEGRGFAVVADEVRSLAAKTQESTGRIRELISNLQTGSQSAVRVMEQSSTKGGETVQKAANAGSALERIEEQVRVINDMNAQIAGAAEEQTAVSNDISRNIESIRGVSDESAQGAEETARAGEDLARLSERLNSLVKQFRI